MADTKEEVNEILNSLGSKPKRSSKDDSTSVSEPSQVLSSKRRVSARTSKVDSLQGTGSKVPKVSMQSTSKSAPTAVSTVRQDGLRRKQLLAMNKKVALMKSNEKVMNYLQDSKATTSKEKDEDYVPSDSDSSAEEVIEGLAKKSTERKRERCSLIKNIKGIEPIKNSEASTSTESPSKEDLKRQLAAYKKEAEICKMKLQMVYEDDEQSSKEVNVESSKTLTNTGEHPDEGADETIKSAGQKNEDGPQHEAQEDLDKTSSVKADRDSFSNLDDSNGGKDDDGFPTNDDLEDHKWQLFGPGKGMVLLCKETYCKKTKVQEALAHSSNAGHVARRLIDGVFTPEAIKRCTLTGQMWRAGQSSIPADDVSPLHPQAIEAIISYAQCVEKNRKWPHMKQASFRPKMSQRLGELRRALLKSKE